LDFRRIRGFTSRVSVLGRLANHYFYKKVKEELTRSFDVEFEDRRSFTSRAEKLFMLLPLDSSHLRNLSAL